MGNFNLTYTTSSLFYIILCDYPILFTWQPHTLYLLHNICIMTAPYEVMNLTAQANSDWINVTWVQNSRYANLPEPTVTTNVKLECHQHTFCDVITAK